MVVVTVSVVAVGCGGSDETASGDTTSTETTTGETTTDETMTGTTAPDLSGVFADEDCRALASVAANAAAIAVSGSSPEATEQLQELAEKVPDEIKADVRKLAAALAKYADKLQEIGIGAGATPSAEQLQELQAEIASLDQQELTASSERIEAWAQENCQG
jgi:hypothetical protein